MDTATGDHPPIAQKPSTLLLKHLQWVHDKLEMLGKLELFHVVFPLSLVLFL